MPRAEWKGRADFAEIAEAVGVPTDHILAAQDQADTVVVFYTPEGYDLEHPDIIGVELRRGTDGVLFASSERFKLIGMWEDIAARIEASLRDRFGEPSG